jgi:integrase
MMKAPETVNDVIQEYINTRKFRALTTSSSFQYLSAIDRIKKLIGDTPLANLKRSDVLRAVESLNQTPAVANMFARVCCIIFNHAVDMDYISSNPAARIRMAVINTWQKWELDQVFAVVRLNHRIVSTAVALAFFTGQRESDVLRMRWSDIKDGTLRVLQQKTGHYLEIKVSKDLQEYLDALNHQGSKSDFIVSGATQMNGNSFRNVFKRVTRSIGIDLPFHGIRKTVGCHLAEKGRSTNEIAAVLGHKTLAMAAHYTRQASDKKMIASAVADLTLE